MGEFFIHEFNNIMEALDIIKIFICFKIFSILVRFQTVILKGDLSNFENDSNKLRMKMNLLGFEILQLDFLSIRWVVLAK